MPVDLADDSLEEKIEIKNENLNEIKNLQKNVILMEHKNNTTLMKKISKLQEYNEINDITNQIFEQRICNIEQSLNELVKKLSAYEYIGSLLL